jgi:hypothetical protein
MTKEQKSPELEMGNGIVFHQEAGLVHKEWVRGYESGQQSEHAKAPREQRKWPSEDEIDKAWSIRWREHSYVTAVGSDHFKAGVNWLKDWMTRGDV